MVTFFQRSLRGRDRARSLLASWCCGISRQTSPRPRYLIGMPSISARHVFLPAYRGKTRHVHFVTRLPSTKHMLSHLAARATVRCMHIVVHDSAFATHSPPLRFTVPGKKHTRHRPPKTSEAPELSKRTRYKNGPGGISQNKHINHLSHPMPSHSYPVSPTTQSRACSHSPRQFPLSLSLSLSHLTLPLYLPTYPPHCHPHPALHFTIP